MGCGKGVDYVCVDDGVEGEGDGCGWRYYEEWGVGGGGEE